MTPEEAKAVADQIVAEMQALINTLSSRAMDDAASHAAASGMNSDYKQIMLALHRHQDLIGPTFEFLDKMISAQKVEAANAARNETSGEPEPAESERTLEES